MDYQFPVRNLYNARSVLEPDFDIMAYPQLYVNLDPARIKTRFDDYRQRIKRSLNIDEYSKRLLSEPLAYKKILFTGYRGSGKTTELKKLGREISGQQGYYVIFIELEREYNITRFQPEDFYFIIFYKFVKHLEKFNSLQAEATSLSEIIRDLISDRETTSVINRRIGKNAKFKSGAGFNALNFLMTRLDIGYEFATGSELANRIRTRIKNRIPQIIENFNEKLRHIRRSIQEHNLGKDILFIIDGLEKVPVKVYDSLIIQDHASFREINANMIISVPIEAHFRFNNRVIKDNFDTFLLPVIRVDDAHNRLLLAEVIKRRIDINQFFEGEHVVDFLVKMSGGVMRQLFKLISNCLLFSDSLKVTLKEAKEIVEYYGKQQFEVLNTKQLKRLKEIKNKKRELKPANEEDGPLLFNLFVLKFSEDYIINPVIDLFI